MALTYQSSVLSENNGAVTPRAEPLPLVVGVRVGTVDGEFNALNRGYMTSHFVAKLSAANLFQQITHPTTGNEDIIFEIGGKFMIKRPFNPLMMGNIFLCAFTLYFVCFPASSSYDYTIAVRATTPNADEVVNRYHVTGTSQITYGVLQGQEIHDIDADGWRLAVTSAYDQLVAKILADEAAYQGQVKP